MITDDSQGDPPTGEELGFPADAEEPAVSEGGSAGPVEERELTAMEMMGAPNRPTDRARQTVLWISLAFTSLLVALTVAVIFLFGIDILTLFSLVFFGFMCVVLIGAVRYQGEDPMAKFDPPPRPKRHYFRRSRD